MNWAEEPEKPPSFLTKTENQRLNWRKPANRTRHQKRKTAIFKSENRKTESKIGQIRKTENPNAPLYIELKKKKCLIRNVIISAFWERTTNLPVMQLRYRLCHNVMGHQCRDG